MTTTAQWIEILRKQLTRGGYIAVRHQKRQVLDHGYLRTNDYQYMLYVAGYLATYCTDLPHTAWNWIDEKDLMLDKAIEDLKDHALSC